MICSLGMLSSKTFSYCKNSIVSEQKYYTNFACEALSAEKNNFNKTKFTLSDFSLAYK